MNRGCRVAPIVWRISTQNEGSNSWNPTLHWSCLHHPLLDAPFTWDEELHFPGTQTQAVSCINFCSKLNSFWKKYCCIMDALIKTHMWDFPHILNKCNHKVQFHFLTCHQKALAFGGTAHKPHETTVYICSTATSLDTSLKTERDTRCLKKSYWKSFLHYV